MKLQSKRIALCGVLCALALVFMLLGGIIPVATFCAPILSMLALLPILEEYGTRFAGAAYGAVSILALLLVPDIETALVYLFFGWYPLLWPRIAALPSHLLQIVCRLAVCNLAMFLLYGVVVQVVGLASISEELGSSWGTVSLVVLANMIFLLLDRVLTNVTYLWRQKLRKRLFR